MRAASQPKLLTCLVRQWWWCQQNSYFWRDFFWPNKMCQTYFLEIISEFCSNLMLEFIFHTQIRIGHPDLAEKRMNICARQKIFFFLSDTSHFHNDYFHKLIYKYFWMNFTILTIVLISLIIIPFYWINNWGGTWLFWYKNTVFS